MLYFDVQNRRTITQCNYNYSPEGILHPDRIMQEYDFLYLTKGSWDIIEEDQTYHLTEGDLLILEPGKHHYSLKKCSPHMRNMYLHCLPLPGDQKKDCTCIPKVTSCNPYPQIARYFQMIIETYWSKKDLYKEEKLANLFSLLLYEIASSPSGESSPDPLVQDIIQLFVTDQNRFIPVEELVSLFSLSAHTLNARFKKSTGTTIYQYQLTQKLAMIHEMLPSCGNRGFRDIALSYGFYDEFQFSKLYKRQYGYSPSGRRHGKSLSSGT